MGIKGGVLLLLADSDSLFLRVAELGDSVVLEKYIYFVRLEW